jgi:two-component system response regulator GlrR
MAGSVLYSVLMVDDNVAMREALARSLTRRGCRVTTAAGAVEGLQALKERSFDAVITDLNMPERGGLWLWRQALILRPALRGRFILIASEPLPDPRSLSLFMETERFVLKPLSLDALWRQVEEALEGVPRGESSVRAAEPPPGRPAHGAP